VSFFSLLIDIIPARTGNKNRISRIHYCRNAMSSRQGSGGKELFAELRLHRPAKAFGYVGVCGAMVTLVLVGLDR
jgi:hypothetical protein